MTWKTQVALNALACALFASSIAGCTRGADSQASQASSASQAALYQVEEKTVAALQDDMAAGRVTAQQLVAIYLQRIRDLDEKGPALGSVLRVNPQAVEDAKRMDAERAGGRRRGPLHGIPVLLKDNIESADPIPTTAGSLALKDNLTGRDAPIVAKLRAAGAVVLGKSNLSEWANIRSLHSTSGWSALGGLTRNPYALDRSVAGSSSGSAAAVAANLAAIAVGTETDGSITAPASFTGVVGLKPTVGLLSRSRIIPISAMQDTAGPITRTVADAAAMLTVMAGSDSDDSATREADSKKSDYVAALSPDALKGKRLGVMKFAMGYLPSVDAAFARAVDQLKSAGAETIDIDKFAGLDAINRDELTVLLTDLRIQLNAYLATTPSSVAVRTLKDLIAFNRVQAAYEMAYFGQDLFEESEKTATHDSAAHEKLKIKNRKAAGPDGIDRLLRQYSIDALIAPTTHPAFPLDLINGDHYLGGAMTLAAVSGYPHLTVPMGQIQGLPLGLSFVGPAWSDASILAMGYAFEQRAGGRRVPTFPATIPPPAATPVRIP